MRCVHGEERKEEDAMIFDIGPIEHMTRREIRKYGWTARRRMAQRPNATLARLLSWLARFRTDKLA